MHNQDRPAELALLSRFIIQVHKYTYKQESVNTKLTQSSSYSVELQLVFKSL